MENDETHIIHRILKGETSLYEYFLDKYSQQVFILIIRIVENQEDAEELTQDTFLKAFEHLSSFKAESSFSTWIYRIAYNTAISATRKRKQELIVMDSAMLMNISDQQIDDALNDESGERVGKLNKAIKKLDAEERALISLFYNEEKTIGEIALILGLTESNAKVKLTLSKILCKWKQDSAVSLFLYLDSVFKNKHKLIHNQAPVMNRLCPFLLNLHK